MSNARRRRRKDITYPVNLLIFIFFNFFLTKKHDASTRAPLFHPLPDHVLPQSLPHPQYLRPFPAFPILPLPIPHNPYYTITSPFPLLFSPTNPHGSTYFTIPLFPITTPLFTTYVPPSICTQTRHKCGGCDWGTPWQRTDPMFTGIPPTRSSSFAIILFSSATSFLTHNMSFSFHYLFTRIFLCYILQFLIKKTGAPEATPSWAKRFPHFYDFIFKLPRFLPSEISPSLHFHLFLYIPSTPLPSPSFANLPPGPYAYSDNCQAYKRCASNRFVFQPIVFYYFQLTPSSIPLCLSIYPPPPPPLFIICLFFK